MTNIRESVRILCVAALLIFLTMPGKALANTAEDITHLLGAVRNSGVSALAPQGPQEAPRFAVAADGYLTHIGAPSASYFPVSVVVPGNSLETAKNFLNEYRGIFGAGSAAVDFRSMKSRKKGGQSYERFQQTYQGIPVFSGETIVQVNEAGGVEYVISDIARNTSLLDNGMLPVVPSILSDEVVQKARDLFSVKRPGLKLVTSTPILKIFDSSVLEETKEMHLVWEFTVESDDAAVNEQVLFDAHTGEMVRDYTLNWAALNRQIYDANNSTAYPGTLSRAEGQPASAIADVNLAYDYFGGIYNFYNSLTNFGRDSIDGAGLTISATVRQCSSAGCPWSNAMWNGSRIQFGEGWPVDDILGHEYTHGVTQYESGLVYADQSGAMNESFSDTFGEFYDLTNGAGTDFLWYRWLIGEDLPGGAIRNMMNPEKDIYAWGWVILHTPDRMSRFLTHADLTVESNECPTKPGGWCGNGDGVCDTGEACILLDSGGVHFNSGIGNKLVYLLTDGDTFNGYTVSGMGITNVAKLYYEVQTNLLTSGATYFDLHWALRQAAVNLNWSTAMKNNLYNACKAVEIAGYFMVINISTTGNDTTGDGSAAYPYRTITKGNEMANPGDMMNIASGSYNENLVFDKAMIIQHLGSGEAVIGAP